MPPATKKAFPKIASRTNGAAHKSRVLSHPSWLDMIKECIIAHPEDARNGVSRPMIKKFVEGKYRIALDNAAANHLNRAISSGNEKGTLYLPKGLSGKIKLAPKARIDTKKENAKPVLKKSAAVTKVSAAKKVPVVIPFATKKARGPTKAKTATVKRSPSKAATSEKPGKKITATTAKTASAKKPRTTTKKTTVAKGAAKKVITGEAKNLKKRKSATAARTGATAPSSKVKPALKVKSALKTAATKSAAKA